MIWHSSTAEQVLKHYGIDDKKGISNNEAAEKLEIYGQNVITKIEKPGFLQILFGQLKSKMVICLIIVALISFALSFASTDSSGASALLIIGVVILNSVIGAYQIYNCNNALDSIKNFTNPSVTVLRDGVVKTINSADLVTGDIMILEEGDYISADGRIIESNELRCNEMSLTGIEIPVEKSGDCVLEDIIPIEERRNLVFTGSSVVHGSAKVIVTAVGIDTEIGKSSAILQQTGDDKLPLQNKLDIMGKIANIAILVVCFVIFIIALIKNFSTTSFAVMTVKNLVDTVSLAVAAIPEGLPMIAMIVISLGIKRILKDNIIVKNISAVETLGKTDILCCDKTGILTRNKMVVTKIFDGDKLCDLSTDQPDEKISTVLKLATACSTLNNDSTEDAIEKACLTYNSMSAEDIGNFFPKVATVPFDSERKTMSVITMMSKHPLAIVKGAPEKVLECCADCDKDAILKLNDELANEGLRIVCMAMKPLDELNANPTAEVIEKDLIFVGLIALDDPPREGVVEDIAACKSAGINTVMITGDNLITAKTVARRIGILTDGTEAITGAELDEMSDDELALNIEKYSVFARITPKDKLRIVKAWQSKRKTVTVTGDNFEDAESLSVADVGCALGKYGTDVAKGNADIIISNNRFHSVLKAIRESRGLFSNIRKSVFYLFSCNIAEIITVLFGWLLFNNMAIAAVQILLINLLTDSLPAISLSLEKAEKSVMNNHRSSVNKIFDLKSALGIGLQSIYLAIVSLVAYSIGNDFGDAAMGSTFAFTVLALAQIFHCFNSKFEGSVINKHIFDNSFMNISVIITFIVVLFLIFTPAGVIFGLEALSFVEFLICLGFAVSIIPISEIYKLIINNRIVTEK